MASTIKQTPISCAGHTRPVVDLNFSGLTNYGYFLISACKDGRPMIRQGDTGDWIGTFEGHKGAVFAASLNRDATRAVTGAADYTAKVWDAESGKELLSYTHDKIVKSVDFNSNADQLLTGELNSMLKIFDLNKADTTPVQTFNGHTHAIKCAKWKPDSRSFFSTADDKTLRLWDVASNECVKTMGFPSRVNSFEIVKGHSRFVITHSNKVAFYDLDTLNLIKEFEFPRCDMNAASYLPEKDMFVCGGQDFSVYKKVYSTGEELEAVKGHFGPVHCIQFSPDGELYASGSEDGTLRLYQTHVGKTYGLWKFENGPAGDNDPVNNCGFADSNKSAVAVN